MFTNLASGKRRLAFYVVGIVALTICGLSLMSAQTAPQQVPSATKPLQPAGDEPVLKAYEVNGEDPVAVAARLQLQLPKDTGISVAPDSRNGRVYVMASPSVQSMIAKLLDSKVNDATNVAPVKSNPSTPASEDKSPRGEQTVTLKNITAKQFEESLTKLIGRQLPVTTDETGTISTYTLSTKGSSPTLVTVNRANDHIVIGGTTNLISAWTRLIGALDRQPVTNEKESSGIVPVRNPDAVSNGSIQKAMSLIGQQVGSSDRNTAAASTSRPVSMLFQPKGETVAQAPGQAAPATQAPPMNPAQGPAQGNALQGAEGADPYSSLIGPVQIEYIEALDIIVIKGHPRDVETVTKIIADIEQKSVLTVPDVRIYNLENVDSQAMANLVRPLFDQFLSARQGRITITSLVKPNALLLIGRKESVDTVVSLIKQLDQKVAADSQFKIFQLRHISATEALATVKGFLTGTISTPTDSTAPAPTGPTTTSVIAPGLGTRATVTADYRSNVLIVRASQRDLEEVEALIKQIDTTTSTSVNSIRVITLKNSLAAEVAPVLQGAITGQSTQSRGQGQNQGQQFNPFQQNQNQNQNQGGTASQQARSAMLELLTYDAEGRKILKSGILTDVRITPDAGSNSLVISAPADSMPLIEALIESLDKPASEKAIIKVFTVKNGDASSLVSMLQALFGQQVTGGTQRQGGGGGGFQGLGITGDGSSDSPLVSLTFSVDQRTNSIIVKGSEGDVSVIELILYRLDGSDVRQRESIVYRLKNSSANVVATSINQLLNNQRNLQQSLATNTVSPFEQFEREVIVVSEPVSNSLVISATPRYFKEIKAIIDDLDRRPPMVMIQVLIAEVQLSNFDEFGVELGLQDSVLFDRSLLGDLTTVNSTTTLGNQQTVQTQTIVGASNTPGFNFNNQPLGNSGSTQALQNSNRVGGQGLTNFAVGRTNDALGFGGLVLSASSDSLSVLLRALKQNRRLEVLSRPQIMTLDNQSAYVQVGQSVPYITSVNTTTVGQQSNAVAFRDVGLILGVTPRITPDGMVVMEIDAERSEVGPEAEGTPIFVNATGQIIRSPRVNRAFAQTTVSAANGQTVILGGLITKNRQDTSRRAPFLSDIPVIGNLFRYDSSSVTRNELLIIMTPRVVRTQQDAEVVKQVEANRMSWCLSDVIRMHGPSGLRNRKDEWSDSETVVVFPDYDPTAEAKAPGSADGAAVNPNAGQKIPGTDELLPPGVLPPGAKIINSTPVTPPAPVPNGTPSSKNAAPGTRSAGSSPPNLIENKQGPTLAPANYIQSQSGMYQQDMQSNPFSQPQGGNQNMPQGNIQQANYFQPPAMQSNINPVQSNVTQASVNQPVQQQSAQSVSATNEASQNTNSQSGTSQGLIQAILPAAR